MKKVQALHIGILICALMLAIAGCKTQPAPTNQDKPISFDPSVKVGKATKAPSMKAVKQSETENSQEDNKPKSLPIDVPDEVKAMYKEVKLRLAKKDGSFKEDFTVILEKLTILGDSGLSVKALVYLPAFYMDQKRITSIGTKPTNPACKATVYENDVEIHTGWLFAKMPQVHAFNHKHYSLTLVDESK